MKHFKKISFALFATLIVVGLMFGGTSAKAMEALPTQPSGWSVDISYRDLNGGAPKIGDIIEFTVSAIDMPLSYVYGIRLIAGHYPNPQSLGAPTITYLSTTCGVTTKTGPYYVVVDVNDRSQTGCPYEQTFTVKYVAQIQSVSPGTLVQENANAAWIYLGCEIHQCWPENPVADNAQFKMNYIPSLLQAN